MRPTAPRVLHPDDSLHPVLDVPSLEACFGPADVLACGEPRGSDNGPGMVSSAFDVWRMRHLREQAGMPGPHALPTDLFVWSIEPPRSTAATRLGGVPCLPRTMPWPRRDGVVGTFYAQLNFTDSRELVPFAPADVLLVFKFFASGFGSWDRQLYDFVWVAVDDRQPLWQPAEVPENGLGDEPSLSGVRVRTFDDPVQVDRIRNDGLPQVHVNRATKVGGAPSDQQSIDPPEVPSDWRFLGQVAGTWPPNGVPFPVLGHPDAVDYLTPEFGRLVHGPGDGIVCLYLDRDDCVQVSFSCS